jgi:hypothetical protein
LVVPIWPHQSDRADSELAAPEVGIGQIERDDLASSKPRLASEQHEREHGGIQLASAIHQPLEVVEVEELDFGLACTGRAGGLLARRKAECPRSLSFHVLPCRASREQHRDRSLDAEAVSQRGRKRT